MDIFWGNRGLGDSFHDIQEVTNDVARNVALNTILLL
jgi:hypothetical protein